MKKLIALALLLLPVSLMGQAARYNGTVYTINASAPLPGALYPVLASTSATINICLAPATGFTVLNAATQSISTGCTNFAPTFTNAAQSGTCSFPTQLTRTSSTTCVKTVDAEGGFGAWMVSGTYQYTITLSYGSFGPYDFSVGGSGGGGGGSLLLQHNGTNLARQDLLNFDDTIPAPPTGFVNGTFQSDTSGHLSVYVPYICTPGGGDGGDPSFVSSVNCGSNQQQQATGSDISTTFSVQTIGEGNVHVLGSHVSDIVAEGDESFSAAFTGSTDIVAIGDAADHQCESFTFTGCAPAPNPILQHDNVFVGDAAGLYNQGSDDVGIGDQSLGSSLFFTALGFYNQGVNNVAVGPQSLVGNTTGIQNTGIGAYAGSDGYDGTSTMGNANHTGSNNTWIGYDSGPNTTTQLSNTAALGYQAHNTASNQMVLGNSSMTQAILFGVPRFPSVLSAPCLGTDGSGNIVSNPGCTGGGSFVYPSGTGVVQVVGGAAWGTTLSLQGTDSKVFTAGTVSGTGVGLCTDANGGATTAGCASTAPNFGQITTGTSTVALHMGAGGTLDTTGGGTIAATTAAALATLPTPCGTGQYASGVDTHGNAICVPLPTQPASQYIAPQAMSGCGVEYVTGLQYTIGACTYSINGVIYNSPLTNVTLAAADPSNPRIDVIFVDTTQTVQTITGTPAVSPQQPTTDPSTQLELTFVPVPAAATTPGNTTLVDIYLEGVEWTGAKGGTNGTRVNLTSTSNPYSGTHDTEFGVGGTVAATTFAGYTVPSAGTVNLANYNTLTFYMRNKAAWATTNSITVQWFNGTTQKGTGVVISNGAFGWNATTNTTTYQQISIPTSLFGIAGVPVTSVRFTVSGTGAALTGFYLDQITLQGGSGGPSLPATLMNFKGPYSTTATYNPNDTITSGGVGYVALATNTNQAVTNVAFWTPLGGSGGGGGITTANPATWPTWLIPAVAGTNLGVTATGIPLTQLVSIPANTILGAITPTTPSALSIPNCNTPGSSALQWTSGIGFGCTTISGGGGGGNTTSTSLTNNHLPKANGINSIIDSDATDDGTSFTYTGSGSVSSIGLTEGTADTPVAGQEILNSVSATHTMNLSSNGGAFSPICTAANGLCTPGASFIDQLTGVTGVVPTGTSQSGITQIANEAAALNHFYYNDGTEGWWAGVAYNSCQFVGDNMLAMMYHPTYFTSTQRLNFLTKLIGAKNTNGEFPACINPDGTSASSLFYSTPWDAHHAFAEGDGWISAPIILWQYYQQTGDLTPYTANVAAIKTAIAFPPENATNHLNTVVAGNEYVPCLGFMEYMRFNSDVACSSVFKAFDMYVLGQMATAAGDSTNATFFNGRYTAIKAGIVSEFLDGSTGLLFAASAGAGAQNVQDDVVSTTFAIFLETQAPGFSILSSGQKTTISSYLATNNSTLTLQGFVREATAGWGTVGEIPVGGGPPYTSGPFTGTQYQGGFWGFPVAGYVQALSLTSAGQALIPTLLTNYRDSINPGTEWRNVGSTAAQGTTTLLTSPMGPKWAQDHFPSPLTLSDSLPCLNIYGVASGDPTITCTGTRPVSISVAYSGVPFTTTSTGVGGNFAAPLVALGSGATAGAEVVALTGTDLSNYDTVYFGIKFAGTNSTNNAGCVGMFNKDNELCWFPNGTVAVGSTTPPSAPNGSLVATGVVDGGAPMTITTGTTAALGGTFQSGYTLNQEATAATAVAYTLPLLP